MFSLCFCLGGVRWTGLEKTMFEQASAELQGVTQTPRHWMSTPTVPTHPLPQPRKPYHRHTRAGIVRTQSCHRGLRNPFRVPSPGGNRKLFSVQKQCSPLIRLCSEARTASPSRPYCAASQHPCALPAEPAKPTWAAVNIRLEKWRGKYTGRWKTNFQARVLRVLVPTQQACQGGNDKKCGRAARSHTHGLSWEVRTLQRGWAGLTHSPRGLPGDQGHPTNLDKSQVQWG